MAEQIEMMKEMKEQPATPSNYRGLGAAMIAELMIGFRFGIGVILAIGLVDSLHYFIWALTSNPSKSDHH